MRNKTMKLLSMVMAFTAIAPICACSGTTTPPGTEEIDNDKTVLFVNNFDGGYGSQWLDAVGERFEELHKDYVGENGKVGVQVYVTNQKVNMENLSSKVLANRDEIYFTEYAYYYTLMSDGILGDITEAVTGDLSTYNAGDAQGATIESKLTAEQKAYYGVKDGNETKYYGIPHYAGYSGLMYNVDLFEERNYYFKELSEAEATNPNLSLAARFVSSASDTKSKGPDGKAKTDDDGLPATYEEFFYLCDRILQKGGIPVIWNGASRTDYVNYLLNALAVDFEGLEQAMLEYTFNGTANNLGEIVNNQFVADAEDTPITESNAYELGRKEGNYRALKFIENLLSNERYRHELSFNNAFSHMDAQEEFLWAGNDGGETPEAAMIVEGVWWENEANDVFEEMENSSSEFAKENRRFAFMPLPKATQEKVDPDSKPVLFDHIYSMCFMKKNIAESKKALAIDFIKFVNTQDSLVEYTQMTNTVKALQYTMTDTQMAEMSHFGRSVMKAHQNSDIVYPYANNSLYANNQNFFAVSSLYTSLVGGDSERKYFINACGEESFTANQYFTGLSTYRKQKWNQLS